MKLISAGIIIKNNKVLVCQRKSGSYYGLKWEFPGGKKETGETIEESLIRELKEELDIDIQIGQEFYVDRHKYPDGFEFEIHFYTVFNYTGIEKNKVFEQIEWADINSLQDYDFLEADKNIIRLIIEKFSN